MTGHTLMPRSQGMLTRRWYDDMMRDDTRDHTNATERGAKTTGLNMAIPISWCNANRNWRKVRCEGAQLWMGFITRNNGCHHYTPFSWEWKHAFKALSHPGLPLLLTIQKGGKFIYSLLSRPLLFKMALPPIKRIIDLNLSSYVKWRHESVTNAQNWIARRFVHVVR